uniref:MFS domain-containing protein n=1 Tax=Hymenolepis diminuta TaxID=6216 RepID=A0A0R3SCL8_HYMDI
LGFSSSVSAQLLIGDGLVAFFSSIINLGALVGSLVVGPMLTNRGRRTTLLISSVPSIIGWLLIAAAKDLSPPATSADPFLVFSLILGRILSGLAAGIMNAVASVYLVEVAAPHQSGRIGSLAQFGTVAGTCFAYYCGMVFIWYETAFLVLLLSVILLAATFLLPESPAWLVKRGQMQAALRDLTWLRGDQSIAMQELAQLASSGTDSEKFILQEHFVDKPLLNDLAPDFSVKTRIIHLLLPCSTIPSELSANLWIAMILMIAQQTTGINVVTFYTEPLCQRMVHVSYSAECAFSLGLAQLLFSLVASLFIIDRLPRRKLLVATGALMSFSMFFFAIGQQFPNSAPISPLVSLIVFLFAYQCGWGPLAMLVTLELFPSAYRGVAGAAAVAVSWGVTFLVTQSFQPLVRLSGELVVFVIHAVLTLLASVYIHQNLPETNPLFIKSFTTRSISRISSLLSFLGLIGFLLGFQCGWGPLALLVSTELTPPQHRGSISASVVATSWTASFVCTQTFQPIVSALNGHSFIARTSAKINPRVANGVDSSEIGELIVFLTYSVLTALATVYFHHRLPETNKAFKPKLKLKQGFA